MYDEKGKRFLSSDTCFLFRIVRKMSTYMVRVTFYSLKRIGDSFKERKNINQLCFNVNETFVSAGTTKI